MAEPTVLSASSPSRLTLGAAVAAKVGDLLGHDGTSWVLADADARVPAQFMAMETVPLGSSVAVCQAGTLFDSDAPYTAGADQYLSATAGAHAGAIPALSATLTIAQRVGKALTTETMVFDLTLRGPMILRAQATVDPASIGAAAAANTAVALTGVVAGDVVEAIPPATLEAVALQSAIAATNSVTLRIVNASAGAIDPASATWTLVLSRY